jgi:flavodoxin short chain
VISQELGCTYKLLPDETGGKECKMSKIQVVYWTQGGNTKAMAEAVGQGVTEAGKEVEVLSVAEASLDALKEAGAFALGCPAMGAEVLEESEMEPFVSDVEKFASGKSIGLFGSYGWGDGQWMRDWVDRMNAAGATVLNGEGVICQETPDDAALAACVELGKQLAGI